MDIKLVKPDILPMYATISVKTLDLNIKFNIQVDHRNTRTQRAEAILNKISDKINKTHTGLISVVQGFQKGIA